VTKSSYRTLLGDDYCARTQAGARRLQVLTDPDVENRQMAAMEADKIDIEEWVDLPGFGHWYRIHIDQSIIQLTSNFLLDSLYVAGSIPLNNDPAPLFNCTSTQAGAGCLPSEPQRPHVFFKRALEYDGLVAEAYACANIIAALTPSEALNGNELALRQQPITTTCQYDTFVWCAARPTPWPPDLPTGPPREPAARARHASAPRAARRVPESFEYSAVANNEANDCQQLANNGSRPDLRGFGLQPGACGALELCKTARNAPRPLWRPPREQAA
jgi:hypothetical protein